MKVNENQFDKSTHRWNNEGAKLELLEKQVESILMQIRLMKQDVLMNKQIQWECINNDEPNSKSDSPSPV